MPNSFNLETDPATVTVEAAYSKHRRQDLLPIRPDLAIAVREHLKARGLRGNELLWPGTWVLKASAKMIRIDLAAAGIPYRDDDDRVFDFTPCGTSLSRISLAPALTRRRPAIRRSR